MTLLPEADDEEGDEEGLEDEAGAVGEGRARVWSRWSGARRGEERELPASSIVGGCSCSCELQWVSGRSQGPTTIRFLGRTVER